MRLIERMMANFSLAAIPGSWLVDTIHSLQYLPSWLPGMSFKRTGRRWNKITHAVTDIPYEFVERQAERSGTWQSSAVIRV